MEKMDIADQYENLHSLCNVSAKDLYPKRPMQCDGNKLCVPFKTVCGEAVEYLGPTTDGILALSNYRFYYEPKENFYNIPLGLIDVIEVKDLFLLQIGCKDASSFKVTFSSNEQCLEWFRRLMKATSPPKHIEEFFAFSYYAWANEDGSEELRARLNADKVSQYNEIERLQFDLTSGWRISSVNMDYKLCKSYPEHILVPACISDEHLESVSTFRSAGRIPAVVWRHTGNGAVIARCSQPEVGLLGWRNANDENLLKAIAGACVVPVGDDNANKQEYLSNGMVFDGDCKPVTKKMLIVDARSYTTAVGNRVRGGGCECAEYYSGCEIQFMNLANIHAIRKSFLAVRQLCAMAEDQQNWLSQLEGTRWLHHMAGLLRSAVTVASAVDNDGRPVLVHCSDGWDRTSQIVALGELLLDPYYRTVEGFQVLCEREWLDFGHKFADRCGHTVDSDDQNERCPVFLQWLDCVHQLLLQFPTSFEFSVAYLVKLVQHVYSNLFGTFLCNTRKERTTLKVYDRTFSVWKFLQNPNFRNHLYCIRPQVLWPSCNMRDLVLWTDVYMGLKDSPSRPLMPSTLSVRRKTSKEDKPSVTSDRHVAICKTRSCDNLVHLSQVPAVSQQRRSSDPNVGRVLAFQSRSLSIEEAYTGEVIEESPQHPASALDLCLPMADLPAVHKKSKDAVGQGHASCKNSSVAQPETCTNGGFTFPDVSVLSLSVDSSTDTLVASELARSFTDVEHDKKKPNDSKILLEKPLPSENGMQVSEHTISDFDASDITSCNDFHKACTNNRHFLLDNDGSASSSTSGKTSRYSTPPLYSYVPCPTDENISISNVQMACNANLDEIDGLTPLHNDVQMRVRQIIAEYKSKEEAVLRELRTTRSALLHQICRHCNCPADDKQDDGGSVAESMCSVELPSAESVPSEVSWEAVEERDACPTLWVPDHAVSRCMGCDTEFWLGRRKHHCRNCGKIFCADCSENEVPLPREQLYHPVRVCCSCYSVIHSSTTFLKCITCDSKEMCCSNLAGDNSANCDQILPLTNVPNGDTPVLEGNCKSSIAELSSCPVNTIDDKCPVPFS
ncbi:myotubularin-related protein 4 isoform X2 [Bacillus rossius redtenbacheri]|uniref:myotubularin-related protein 4 isoform X2 n=1 Tax=Bacillus rossius redtenbacheri TaxID=93214 RepID=UPI002FDDB6A3